MDNVIRKKETCGPGDTIGICAPSARFDIEVFNRGIAVLHDLGFKTKVPTEIFQKKRYLAGDDGLRARVMASLFADPDIDAILCARGGFGAMRILEHLDWQVIGANPKPFIGFSDNTAILMAIYAKTGNPVIHGPTLLSLAKADSITLTSFVETLTGKQRAVPVSTAGTLSPGTCDGPFLGGNLATISHLLGTPYQPVFKGGVLFLEDVGEPAYKIDRMLSQLKMAGVLDGVKGLVTGKFTDCDNGEYITDILTETFKDMDIPILSGVEAGHGGINYSLSMGRKVFLDAGQKRLSWV